MKPIQANSKKKLLHAVKLVMKLWSVNQSIHRSFWQPKWWWCFFCAEIKFHIASDFNHYKCSIIYLEHSKAFWMRHSGCLAIYWIWLWLRSFTSKNYLSFILSLPFTHSGFRRWKFYRAVLRNRSKSTFSYKSHALLEVEMTAQIMVEWKVNRNSCASSAKVISFHCLQQQLIIIVLCWPVGL